MSQQESANEDEGVNQVQGERDNSVTRVLSAQSRISNALAIGLMSVLGLGSLAWYYASALMRQGRVKESAQAASTKRAQGEMPLPSLGRIDPPAASAVFEPVAPPESLQDRPPPPAPPLPEILASQNATGATNGVAPPKTPAQLALEREMSGAVFSPRGAMQATGMAAGDAPLAAGFAGGDGVNGSGHYGVPDGIGAPSGGGSGVPSSGELGALLRPSVTTAVRAQVLPAQRLLLPKGAFIDCTLETAIDSTLPGMTTCVMATDTFGVDGNVVLLERGTKLIGETRGQVQQGAARIFVLWTEARTPTGVVVPLDSPGADELGRSGLPGEVNRHFWQRFGAAMLVSVIDGAMQAAAQSSRNGGSAVVVNPSASQDVLTEILKNTINIPPTVVKRNGDRIQVLVARDLDFRSVYELRSVASER
jgi:type IV secretion system protein VirB10